MLDMQDFDDEAETSRAVGARLSAARAAKGWSLQALAERLGVTKATVGHWETGARTIKLLDLRRLCAALDVSADQMLFGERRWPFDAISYEAVRDLEPQDRQKLEGALLLTAAQIGIEIGKQAIAA